MEGFGIEKILLILIVVLLFFGAKRIPEIAGSFGKGIREFKRSMSSIEDPAALPPPAPPVQATADRDRAEPKKLLD